MKEASIAALLLFAGISQAQVPAMRCDMASIGAVAKGVAPDRILASKLVNGSSDHAGNFSCAD